MLKCFERYEKTELRNIVLLLIGQFSTMFGTQIFGFAMSFYILSITGSATAFSFSLIINFLPKSVLSMYAGILTDRYSKKRIIVFSDLVAGIFLLGVTYFDSFEGQSIITIYIAQFVLTCINSFYTVAFDAAIPQIVSNEHLMKINSVNNTIGSLSRAIGPVLGGTIIMIIDYKFFFVINGVTFVLSAVCEMFMDFNFNNPKNIKKYATQKDGGLGNGLSYILKNTTIRFLWIYSLMFNGALYFGLIVPMPYVVVQSMQISAQNYGIIQSAMSVGAFATGLLLSLITSTISEGRLLRISSLMLGIGIGAIGVIGAISNNNNYFLLSIVLLVVVMFLLGSSIVLSSVATTYLLQTHAANEFRGRVMGTLRSSANLVIPIAIIISGILLDRINPLLMLIIFGSALSSLVFLLAKYFAVLDRGGGIVNLSLHSGRTPCQATETLRKRKDFSSL